MNCFQYKALPPAAPISMVEETKVVLGMIEDIVLQLELKEQQQTIMNEQQRRLNSEAKLNPENDNLQSHKPHRKECSSILYIKNYLLY